MLTLAKLSPEDCEQIASVVVAKLAQAPAPIVDTDPWLTRDQAARYTNVDVSTFDRLRAKYDEQLAPALENPLRFAKSTLDTFKLLRGAHAPRRRRARAASAVPA